MDELSIINEKLPENPETLAQYDKWLSARQPVYRRLLKDIKDWKTASEEEKRILTRAQDEAEYLIDVRAKIGEMMKDIPKASHDRGNQYTGGKDSTVGNSQSAKINTIESAGFTKSQAQRYQTLAKHPEIVEKAKQQARENHDVVTQTAVLNAIKENKQPHVFNNSHDNEWYTPEIYIEAAREVMGGVIDLDPASNDFANQTVKAEKYYSIEDDGLQHEWFGNIWMNPPYSTKEISDFARKLSESTFNQAIVLVNNATETEWFRTFIQKANAIVFSTGRIKYRKRDGEKGTPLQGQAFIYFGQNENTFLKVFSRFGWGCKIAKL